MLEAESFIVLEHGLCQLSHLLHLILDCDQIKLWGINTGVADISEVVGIFLEGLCLWDCFLDQICELCCEWQEEDCVCKVENSVEH